MKELAITLKCQNCDELTAFHLMYEPGEDTELVKLPCHNCSNNGIEVRVPGVHIKGLDEIQIKRTPFEFANGTFELTCFDAPPAPPQVKVETGACWIDGMTISVHITRHNLLDSNPYHYGSVLLQRIIHEIKHKYMEALNNVIKGQASPFTSSS